MKLSDFRIGAPFYVAGGGNFICTDIGTRVVVAVHADDAYRELETVFDEYCLPACFATAEERDADAVAVAKITAQTIRRRANPAKAWLDDIRTPPDASWTWVKTAPDAIAALEAGNVVEISLDHDLGDDKEFGTGYDVVCWIEEAVATKDFVPPKMRVHSANVVGCARMEQGIAQIMKSIRRQAGMDA